MNHSISTIAALALGMGAAQAGEPVEAADAGAQQAQPATPTAQPAAATAQGPRLQVLRSDEYGPVLTSAEGHSLYVFSGDTKGRSSGCADWCADMWPPVTGGAVAGEGLRSELIGSIQRPDGTTQTTYNGWPLYRYVGDEAPNQYRGQDIRSFGGEWHLLSPAGDKVRSPRPGT